MLKSLKTNNKCVGLILSNLGLIVASIIIVGLVFGFAAVNVWQADAEAYNVALDFSRSVGDLKESLTEYDMMWEMPDFASVSYANVDSNEICVVSETAFGQKIIKREMFESLLLIVNESFVSYYGSGFVGFHQNFLMDLFNRSGSYDDPLDLAQRDSFFEFVNESYNQSKKESVIICRNDERVISSIDIFYVDELGLIEKCRFVVVF